MFRRKVSSHSSAATGISHLAGAGVGHNHVIPRFGTTNNHGLAAELDARDPQRDRNAHRPVPDSDVRAVELSPEAAFPTIESVSRRRTVAAEPRALDGANWRLARFRC